MRPIIFEGANVTYAKDQPEYLPLPAYKSIDGIVTTCWELTPEERIEILETGCVYLQQMTFNQPLQPVKISLENPL